MREPAPSNVVDARSGPRRVWLWLLIGVVALGAAAVLLLPYGIRYGLERWLRVHGASEVSIGAVEANAFTGAIRVRDLAANNGEGPLLRLADLRLQFLWQGLWDRRTAFDSAHLNDAEAWLPTPLLGTLARGDEGGWETTIRRLQLSNVAVHLTLGDTAATWQVHQGVIEPWSSLGDEHSRVALSGTLDGAPARLEGSFTLSPPLPEGNGHLAIDDFALARLPPAGSARQWQGNGSIALDFRLATDRDGRPQLSHDGTVRVRQLRLQGPEMQLQSAAAAWAGQGTWQFSPEALAFEQQGQWTLSDADLALASGRYGAANLVWEGELHGRTPWDHAASINADGSLQGQDLAWRRQTGPALQAASGRWQGSISHGMLDVPGGLAAQGQLQLSQLRLGGDRDTPTLLSAAEVQLRDLDIKGSYRIAAGELALRDTRLMVAPEPQQAPLLHAQQARLDTVRFSDQRYFAAAQLELEGMQLALRRQADGSWFGFAPPSAEPPGDTARRNHWQIERIAVSGDDNTLRFEDQSVHPTFARTLQLQQLSLGELDSTAPRQPSPLALEATMADGSRVVAVGKLQPFAERLNLALKTSLNRVPLPPLSPYGADHLGVRFAAGTLNAQSDLHVIDGQLRSANVVELRGLRLENIERKPAQRLRQELGMPVPLAAALLAGADERLVLDLALRGDLEAADFRLGSAFDQALGSALRSAGLATVNRTLHPFGTAAAQSGPGLRLEPLQFRVGSAQLNQVARTYLRRLAVLLRQHPQLRLQVCGLASPADGVDTGIDPSALARQRAEAVLSVLAEDHKIGQRRASACESPAVDSEQRPAAELLLL